MVCPLRLHRQKLFRLSHCTCFFLPNLLFSRMNKRRHPHPRPNKATRERRRRAALRAAVLIPPAVFPAPANPSLQAPCPTASPDLRPSTSGPRILAASSCTTLPPHARVHFIRVPLPTTSSLSSGRLDFSRRYDDLEPLRGNPPPTPRTLPPQVSPRPLRQPSTSTNQPYDFLVPSTPTGPLPPTPGKWYIHSRPLQPPALPPSSPTGSDILILDTDENFSSPSPISSPPPKLSRLDSVPRRHLGF